MHRLSALPAAAPGSVATVSAAGIRMNAFGDWFSRWVAEPVASAAASAATYVADKAEAVGQSIRDAFVTVTVAGQQIYAKAVDTLQAGATVVTYYVDQAGQSFVAVGNLAIQATRDAAEGFARNLEKLGKSFDDLWNQLTVFGTAAKQVLTAIVNDPAGFLSNLAAGVGTGFQNFVDGLGTTLQNSLFQWLTGGTGLTGVQPPTDFTAAGLGQWLLGFFKLDWPHIQQVLVNTLGAGNVALVTQAYQYLSDWVDQGMGGVFNWLKDAAANLTPDQLMRDALQAGIQYLTNDLAPRAVAFIAAKFAVPVAGVVSDIYDTVGWLFNSLGQVQQLAGLATQVAQQIGDVVAGQTTALANAVTGFLNGLVPVGISFLATQLHISDLPQAVGKAIEKIRNTPLDAIQAGIASLADKAKKLLGLGGATPRGLVAPATVFFIGPQRYKLWTEMTSTGAKMEMAPDGGVAGAVLNPFNDIHITQAVAAGQQAATQAGMAMAELARAAAMITLTANAWPSNMMPAASNGRGLPNLGDVATFEAAVAGAQRDVQAALGGTTGQSRLICLKNR